MTELSTASFGVFGHHDHPPMAPGGDFLRQESTLPPLPSSDIIGRDDDILHLIEIISSRQAPLLTILGPGGVGKTRLALTLGWRLNDSFRDGVLFVSLINESVDGIWGAIARGLGVTRKSGESWLARICETLAHRDMLIILDDCEHVCAAFTELAAILAQCPNVVFLTTSQNPLQLDIEHEFWLQPLTLPSTATDLADISMTSAVELFLARTRRLNPSFTINERNAPDIVAIVRLLDGLPLAIELAAGQMRHFSTTELRHQLERSLPSLASASRDLPERHRSLINVTAWSLNLLSTMDRRRFLRLTVIAREFTPETAFQIMGVSDIEGWTILTDFADKSLIKRVGAGTSSPSETPRFFILQTLHAGARYLLQKTPEEYADALQNHAETFLTMARNAARDWHGPHSLEVFHRMDKEHENYENILENSLAYPHLAPFAIDLAEPLFWYVLSRNREAWVLPRLERLLDDKSIDVSSTSRGIAHVAAGWFAVRQNHLRHASWHFNQSAHYLSDPTTSAALFAALGEAYLLRVLDRDDDAARSKLSEIIQLAGRQPGRWFELSAAYFALGLSHYFDGEFSDARQFIQHALDIARPRQDTQSMAMNLLYLARIDRLLGNDAESFQKLQESLPILLAGGDVSNILLGLDIAIMILVDAGHMSLVSDLAIANEHLRARYPAPRSPEEQADIAPILTRVLGDSTGMPPVTFPEDTPSLRDLVNRVVAWRETIPKSDAPLGGVLTKRELEVLNMVADGKTSSEIARDLFLSPHTIKRHMANIRARLGVRSQAAAVAMLRDRP